MTQNNPTQPSHARLWSERQRLIERRARVLDEIDARISNISAQLQAELDKTKS